jgi:hypothetical protein
LAGGITEIGRDNDEGAQRGEIVAPCAMALAPKTASPPTTMPILLDRAILLCNMLPSR